MRGLSIGHDLSQVLNFETVSDARPTRVGSATCLTRGPDSSILQNSRNLDFDRLVNSLVGQQGKS